MSLYPSPLIYPRNTLYPNYEVLIEDVNVVVSGSVDLTVKKAFIKNIPIDVSLDITVGRIGVPIMGYVYAPTDQFGQQVLVQADLWDDYYQIDDSTETPTLVYGPQSLSHNVTNDQYNVWKIK